MLSGCVVTVLGGVTVLCFGPPAWVLGRWFERNKLSGSIPVELGQLTRVNQLYVSVLFLVLSERMWRPVCVRVDVW